MPQRWVGLAGRAPTAGPSVMAPGPETQTGPRKAGPATRRVWAVPVGLRRKAGSRPGVGRSWLGGLVWREACSDARPQGPVRQPAQEPVQEQPVPQQGRRQVRAVQVQAARRVEPDQAKAWAARLWDRRLVRAQPGQAQAGQARAGPQQVEPSGQVKAVQRRPRWGRPRRQVRVRPVRRVRSGGPQGRVWTAGPTTQARVEQRLGREERERQPGREREVPVGQEPGWVEQRLGPVVQVQGRRPGREPEVPVEPDAAQPQAEREEQVQAPVGVQGAHVQPPGREWPAGQRHAWERPWRAQVRSTQTRHVRSTPTRPPRPVGWLLVLWVGGRWGHGQVSACRTPTAP